MMSVFMFRSCGNHKEGEGLVGVKQDISHRLLYNYENSVATRRKTSNNTMSSNMIKKSVARKGKKQTAQLAASFEENNAKQ